MEISAVVFEAIDERNLDPWESDELELNEVSTWSERVVVKLMYFYNCCSNNGKIYPHLDLGLISMPEFEAVGANSTINALKKLERLRNDGFELTDCKEIKDIELEVPSDFFWTEAIDEYVQAHTGEIRQTSKGITNESSEPVKRQL